MGFPFSSTSIGNMCPSERFALCEIASSSLPALRCPSIHFHRSVGDSDSSELNGMSGTLAQSRKNTLRCMFLLFGVEVHSYEQNAVNLPGSFAASAIATLSFHTVPATSGL